MQVSLQNYLGSGAAPLASAAVAPRPQPQGLRIRGLIESKISASAAPAC